MSAVVAPPLSPFKGLAAFEDSELDALFFFGREQEREVVVSNLLASRLTLFYGESGVGKSSLLAAGVVRELRASAPGAVVVLHDTWSAPLDGLFDEVRDADEGYLILDQFEEYFLYHGVDDRPGTLVRELPDLLADSRVNVLVSLREDAVAQLDAFKARIPSIFANQVRLEHLDRTAARAAIIGPVARWNELTDQPVEIEPALVEATLDEVSAGTATGRPPAGQRIEAPYLQLVLQKIWDVERADRSRTLRLQTLRDLGGASSIVRDHLEDALAALTSSEQDVAAEMFGHLVTPSGTKIAHEASDLAEYADVPEDVLRTVLAALTRDRIVHSVDGSDRFEIFHDVLTEPIRAWRQQRRLEQERRDSGRRQRRLLIVAVASAVLLAVVAAIALFALAQRGHARSQARQAHAGELAATALADLGRDPVRSLQLALAATRLERNPRIEEVLRTALRDSHLRLVLPAGGAITVAAFSPDSKRAVVGSNDGSLSVYDLARARRVMHVQLDGAVSAAAFSPDSRRVLVGGGRGRVAILQVGRGKPTFERRLPGGVRSAVFSADGTLVAAAGGAGTVRIWNSGDGRLVRTLAPGGTVTSVALSPAGSRLAAVSLGSARRSHVALYDLDGGRLVAELPDANRIAFSPRGSLLATGGGPDLRARVWSATDGTLLTGFPHGGTVTAVEFSPDGRQLLTASSDGATRVWGLSSGERQLLMPTGTNVITSARYSADGKYIVTASNDGSARIWSARNGRELVRLLGHRDSVNDAAFDRGAGLVITASDDRTARIWDTALTDQLRVLGRERGSFVRVGFVHGGTVAFGASSSGTVDTWRLRGRGPTVRAGRAARLADGAVNADGSLAAALGAGGVGRVWRLSSGHVLATFRMLKPGRRVAFSPDGRRLLFAGGHVVHIVDATTLRPLARLRLSGSVVDAGFSADGSHVVAAASDGRVVVWTAGGALVRTVDARPTRLVAVELSPDASLVAAAARDGRARIWSVRTGRLQHASLAKARTPLATLSFSPDGRFLATAAIGGDARVWRVKDGTLVHILRGHIGRVAAVAFSPDGRWIVTAGPTAAGLWRTSTGNLLVYLRGHSGQVESAAFAPDGEQIVTGSADGTVRTYDCRLCGTIYEIAHLARVRLSHIAAQLTPQERRRYLGG